MALQPIEGYPSDYLSPFSAVQIDFGQGPSTGGSGPRPALYVGPKTSGGTGTANKVYLITRESQASTLAGDGSFAHRMVRKQLQTNPGGRCYMMLYAASSGAGVAIADATLTIANTATAAGRLRLWVCDEELSLGYANGATPTAIGDIVEEAVSARPWLPVTASNAAGTVTFSAKLGGASSGDGTTGVLRVRAEIETSGTSVTASFNVAALGLTGATAGADGATTELANLTTALATIDSSRYYYMGFSVWSSTAIAIIKTHIVNKSAANPGLRSCGFTGYTGTLSSLATIAIGVNHERRSIIWQENSEHDVADLVGWCVATHQRAESVRGGFVGDFTSTNGLIKPVYDPADRPTGTDIENAALDGIMTVASTDTGAHLVMALVTRSKDSTGAINDKRAIERHRISFMDDFADTWLVRDQLQFRNFKLTDDPYVNGDPDQGIDFNAIANLPPRTLCPHLYKKWFSKLITEFATAGVLQRPQEWKDSLAVNIDPLNVSRIEAGDSGRTYDIRHQATLRLQETTPG